MKESIDDLSERGRCDEDISSLCAKVCVCVCVCVSVCVCV